MFTRRGSPKAAHFRRGLGLVALLLLISAASACGVNQPGMPTLTPTLTLTPTFVPTLTPTPYPLGSEANPYIFGVVSQTEDAQISAAADTIAQKISQTTGKKAAGKVFPSNTQLLEGLSAGKVHAAWLPPFTYIYASQRGLAEVALLTNHFGVYQYGTQFLANISSNFIPYFDPISGLDSADATTALAQFRGMRPCWVDPQSASGYILPAGLLRLNEIDSQPAVWAQNHTAVIRALYVKGICDYGATFALTGDPRTSPAVRDDLPDVMTRIMVVWRSEGNIPNFNLSLLAGLSESDRLTLTNAFLDIAKTDEGKALLTLSADNYEIEDIKPVTDEIYDPLREMTKALDLDLRELIGK